MAVVEGGREGYSCFAITECILLVYFPFANLPLGGLRVYSAVLNHAFASFSSF